MTTPESAADRKAQDAAWEEHAIGQMLYFRSSSLRARMQAVEGMCDVVRLLERARAEGKIRPGRPRAWQM